MSATQISRSPAARGPIRNATRAGWRQALTDLRINVTGSNLAGYLVTPIVTIGVLWFVRDSSLDGTGITLAHYMFPGFLAMILVVGGITGVSGELMTEREDGSLLRMKAVPHGLRGYAIGKVLQHVLLNLSLIAIVFIAAIIIVPEIAPDTPLQWLGFLGYVVLGLLATLPVGVALGAAVKNMMGLVAPTLAVYALLVISGIFTPLETFASWLGTIAQFFPLYWLGLGLRSVFLPAEAAIVEVGESWRTLETLGVLGIWAAVGLILAPIVLRRMIRGVSGSSMQQVRERLLTKGY